MIHAYQVSLQIRGEVDIKHIAFKRLLVQRRAQIKARIALYGGDPLPGEGVNARLDPESKTITVLWRSHIGPERNDLIETIRDLTDQFTTIASWRVDHHICGNGRRKPCGAWQTILENE